MTTEQERVATTRRLVADARRLTVLVRQVATPLLAEHDLTIAGQAILHELLTTGPATVPVLARQNLLTRQAVQRLMDDLHSHRFVERAGNPAHQRSVLWAIASRGRQALTAASSVETELLATLADGLAPQDVEVTRATVQILADRLAAGATRSRPPASSRPPTDAGRRPAHP